TGAQFVGSHEALFNQQFFESVQPDLVVGQIKVVGQRLACRARHVEIPATGRAKCDRQRMNTRLPGGMEHGTFRFRDDSSEAAATADVGVTHVGHVSSRPRRARGRSRSLSRVSPEAQALLRSDLRFPWAARELPDSALRRSSPRLGYPRSPPGSRQTPRAPRADLGPRGTDKLRSWTRPAAVPGPS